MVHKQYIWKNGKRFGPYYYESYREGTKVKKRYIKNPLRSSLIQPFTDLFSRRTTNQALMFLIIILALGAAVYLFSLIPFTSIGNVALEIGETYTAGDSLGGVLRFTLQEGELIPADSLVQVSLNDYQFALPISTLVSEETISGKFFGEGTALSGDGAGYGLPGDIAYSELSVDLRVYALGESAGQESASSGSSSDVPDQEEPTPDTLPEEAVDAAQEKTEKDEKSDTKEEQSSEKEGKAENAEKEEKTEKESDKNSEKKEESDVAPDTDTSPVPSESTDSSSEGTDSSDSGSSSDSSSSSSSSSSSESSAASSDSSSSSASSSSDSGSITGQVISEESFIVTQTIHAGEETHYMLEPGQNAELVAGSVRVKGKESADSLVELTREGRKVILHMASENEQGFGEEFLGPETKTYEINLSAFLLTAQESGTLRIELLSQGETLLSLDKEIGVEQAESNESVEALLNETLIPGMNDTFIPELNQTDNETLILNQTGLRLIQEIPTLRIQKGESVEINLSNYFAHAEHYSIEVANISASFADAVVTITPDTEFSGARSASITASAGNESINSNEFTILVSSGAVRITTGRDKIKVGEPVRWVKNVSLDVPDILAVQLPAEAINVSVTVQTSSEPISTELAPSPLTASVISDLPSSRGIFSSLARITGNAVDTAEQGLSTAGLDVVLDENATEYVIEYYTPGPEIQEEEMKDGKLVAISAPDELGYTDVIASMLFNSSEKISDLSRLKLYWRNYESNDASTFTQKLVNEIPEHALVEEIDSTRDALAQTSLSVNASVLKDTYVREEVPFDAYDLDGDGNYDLVEWVVPHLSNQSYEFIYITDAIHLDENRIELGNIYDAVRYKDGNWSEPIPATHYVRVAFEQNLTNRNDITLYARNATPGASVQVYTINGDELIADFGLIDREQEYKVYLTNLEGEEDMFDLQVTGGLVEFDYIVDPIPIGACGILSTGGETYILNNNISTGNWGLTQCIKITANSITLDGNGYTINETGSVSIGVLLDEVSSVTVKNLNLANFPFAGIQVKSSALNNILNNKVYSSVNSPSQHEHGVLLYPSPLLNTVANNTLRNGIQGVFVFSLSESQGGQNIITNNSINTNRHGIHIRQVGGSNVVSYNYVYNNGPGDVQIGVGITVSSSSNTLLNNTLWGNEYGYHLYGGTGNLIHGGRVSDSSSYGILIDSGTNILRTISLNGSGSEDIRIGSVGGGSTTLIDMHPSPYSFQSLTHKLILNETGKGGIMFNDVQLVDRSNLSADVHIGNNTLVVVSGVSALNLSANLTLLQLAPRPGANYSIFRDNVQCAVHACTNLTALNLTNVSFIVTGSAGNYSIQQSDDQSAPDITINFPANRTYNATPLNFNVSLSENGTAEYTITNGVINISMQGNEGTFGTSFNASNNSIRDGSYTLRVYANDTKGNAGTANVTFFIDTQYPNITYVNQTETDQITLNRLSILVNVTAEDAFLGNITIRLYNTTTLIRQNVSTTSPFFINYSYLLDGTYRFNATASDTSGNVNHTPTRTVYLDALSPLITINFPANRTYNSTPLNFNVSLSKNGTVLYSLNGGIVNVSMSSTDNKNFNASNSSIRDGSYTFRVYSNDTLGNRNDTANIIFFVDTQYPNISYQSPSESDQSILGRTNIMVNVTAEDAFLANITIRLYNSTALIRQNFSTNASFFINYTSLLDGVYRFNATASDTSGNVNHTSTRSVTVDALSPLVTINFPANRTYNSTPLNFNVSTNKNTTVFYSLDSGINNVSMSSTDNRNFNASNSSIINGSYTFIVYANDTAGNRNDTSRVIFFIDTGYPKIDYLAATESDGVILQTRRDLIVNITSNDTFFANITIRLYNGSHSRIRLNESNLSLFMINYTGLSDGLYFFNATASDTSGNVNHTSSRNVTVDLNAPHVLIVFPANQTYTSVISALNYSAIDFNLQACWYTLDNGVTNTTLSCGTNVTSLNSGDGSATWRVYANDTNGKVNSSTITFFVDSVIPPSISFVTPTETTGTLFTTRNNTLINVSATDTNLANITIRLYNTTSLVNESFTTASVFYLNITNLSDGIYFFNATAVDTAGNTNSTETRNVTIDVHAPVLTVNFPGNQSYAVYTLNFNASLNENGTVLYTLDEGLNNRTMTATDNQNYIATNNSIINGGYRIRFYSNDTAGNRNDTTFVDFSFQNLNLTVCQNLTVDDSNYIVSQEITTTTSCFLVTANNIVLEGAGYSLSGDRSGIDYGIHVRGAQNVTIQNINVTNFNEGILLNLTNISLLSNVSVSYNVNTGIVLRNSIINELFNIRAHNNTYGIQVLASSSENLLRRVNASNNSQVGILINASSNNDVVSAITHMNSIAGVQIAESSSGNELSNVDSRHTVFGILINASSENVIGSLWSTNNTRGAAISNGSSNRIVRSNLSSNSQYGISFTETAASNTLEASETRLNTLQGIFVNGSHNNITLSLSEYNSLQGIYLAPGVQNTTISGTSVARNLKEGVYLNMSHNNTLRNNTIINHSSSGLYLMESRDNTFSGNNVSLIRFFVADETVPSSGIGIVLIRSPSNTFSDNVLEHNQMAFVSNWSNDLSFTRDQFKEGVYGGVFTSSNATRFNKVHFENFADGELGDIGYGLVINASADTNISFSTFVSNYRGLLVYHSRNLTVENSSFNNNNRDGFILDGSYNATILGSSMTGNGGGGTGEGSGDGLRLLNSSFTTLRYSTFVENYGSAGLYLHQSHNNTIVGVTTRSQYDDGIALLRSHNNTFVNTTGVSDGSLGEGSGSSITLSSSLYNVFVNSTTNYSDLGVVLSNANYTFFAALTSIGNDDGLSLTASHNNTFAGVTATSNTDKGISLSSSFNNTFVNSTTNLNIYGFYLSSSSNNTFLNATAVNNTASGNDGFAVYLESNSTQNSFYNTTIANTAGAGITISSSAYTIFKNASITSSRKDAISLQGASSRNTTFDAVFVSGTNASFFDIDFESASINYTLLLDTHLNRYNFTGVGGIVYFSDTNEGDLFFLATLNGTGQNLSLDIAIGNNSIFANSSQPGLNRSANITLYGIGTGFINPAVLRDGVTCLIPACNNFTSLNAGTVRFNISGFSTYSIGESAGVAPDTSLPAVYLQAPLNGSSFTNGNVSFNATFADNFRLANATFYLWNASALVNTTFRVLDGISNSTNISVALPHQGTFFWNYRVADNSSNYAFNHTNWTITYNASSSVQLLVGILSPTNTTYTSFDMPLIFNVTLSQSGATVLYTLSGGVVNYTLTANASSTGYNATNTSISNGAYTFRVYANNSDGTRNDTASIIFSFRATNLTACGEINGAGYTYRLGQDILNAAGTCFNITSDHVILDGSGRIIDGDDTGSDYGIIAANRRNLTIRNINISDFASGIYLNRTHDSFIINATLNSNTEKGIRLDTSSNNSVLRGSVNASGQDALYIEGGISTGNNLTNVSIANTAANFNDFTTQTGYGLTSVDVNNTGIIDTYLARYNISSIGGLFFFISSGKAEIRFLRAINGSGANLSAEIILGNNTVFVNGSKSTLNKTANITFYGISTGFSNPQMLRDGTACSSPICNNLTSLNAGTVIFNVSSWSNYSIGEGQDIIAPVVTLNSLTGNLSVSQVTFNISTNESAGTALYSLHSGTINVSMQKNGNTNFNYTNTSIADGTYTVRFYVNDTSGNRNDSVSRVFTIDTTNPTVYLQAPVNDSTSGIATISFNATFIDGIGLANATFYLWNASALVNTTVGTLSSTSGSINLSVALPHQGRFFWNYRSSDTLSNYAFNNTNYTIVYSAPDTTAPAVYLQAPINGSTVEDGNVSFNATFTEGIRLANATFYLWNASALVNTTFRVLDGISNSTNISVALPHQGTFFWNYRVADNSSNYAFNHTNYTLIYSVTDAIVPLVTVNFPANTTYTNSSFPLIFNVSLNENGSRVWYTLDAWATNVSMSSTDNRNYNASNTSISDGSYVFRVFANDTSNNVNSSASVAFSVDRTLPLINVTAPTNISYSNATIQVNFSASDSNSINTRWFMNDTGNTTYTGVTSQQASEGSHIWRFYANDSNGNANSTSVTFSVDSVLPSVQFISPSEVNASNLSRSTILINVTASDSTLASIVIRLFNVSTLMNTTVSATSPNFINYTGLADGVYYFNATANDTQNNINVTETRTLKIDTVIPVISFISPHTLVNDTYVKTSAFTVNVSSVDANFANITLYLTNATSSYDVETFATANASKNYTGLADGVYYFNASSRDGASNTNSTNTRRVTVDTTIPLVSFISPHTPSNGSSLTSTSFAVNISVNETNLANITFYLSNSTTLLNTSHHISSILFINYTGLNATTYFVNASIVDLAGNINTTQVRTVIIQSTEVDTTAPVVTIILPVNVSYSNTSIGFNVSLNENGTLLYSLNGGITNVSMRGNEGNIFGTNFNHTNASISEGSYTFRIYANDTSGNRNETTQIAFSIDRTPPVITINFPANTTYTSLPITFNVSLNENGAVHYSLNGGITNVSMRASDGRNFNASNSSILNGAYSFIVYANDSAGNVNSSSVTFSLGVSEESTPASSAGGGGGGGGGSSSTLIVTPPKLKVIPEVLSVSSKTEETVSVSFTVFNTGNTRADVQLEDNLGETLHFADDRFTLEAGENRTIILLFAAYNLEPDVYTGKLIVRDQQGGELQVPVMYNVRSKSALFDVMLSIPLGHKRPMLGADLPFDVTLLNLGDLGKVDATLYYTIKNLENRTLLEFSETLAVETSISFSRTVRLPPEMLPGQHVIAVRVVYGEENVATASELFSAREPRTWIGYLLISALTLAILFIVLVLGYTLWKQHTGKTHPLLEQIPGLATH